jgi:hypothetical protein
MRISTVYYATYEIYSEVSEELSEFNHFEIYLMHFAYICFYQLMTIPSVVSKMQPNL